jgi:hypothetical protein
VIAYHRNGRPSRVVTHEHDPEQLKQVARTIRRFNRRGDITRKTVRDTKGVVEKDRWFYDRRGRLTRQTHENKHDQMSTSTLYERAP